MKKNKYLIRKIHPRKTKTPVVIITNGETEEIYFNGFKDRDASHILHVRNTNSAPQNLPKQVSNIIQSIHIGKTPEIWIVTDKDKFPIKIAASLAKAKKYNFIYSIPSIEIWFLLHFCYTSASMTPPLTINRLSKHLGSPYNKTGNYFDILKSHQATAIKNAKKLEQHHTKQGVDLLDANPYTNVYLLVERLTNK